MIAYQIEVVVRMAAAEAVKAFEWRVFEKLLKSKSKNATFRRKVIRNLLTELVEKERVETTLARAQDVARVANRVGIRIPSTLDESTWNEKIFQLYRFGYTFIMSFRFFHYF